MSFPKNPFIDAILSTSDKADLWSRFMYDAYLPCSTDGLHIVRQKKSNLIRVVLGKMPSDLDDLTSDTSRVVMGVETFKYLCGLVITGKADYDRKCRSSCVPPSRAFYMLEDSMEIGWCIGEEIWSDPTWYVGRFIADRHGYLKPGKDCFEWSFRAYDWFKVVIDSMDPLRALHQEEPAELKNYPSPLQLSHVRDHVSNVMYQFTRSERDHTCSVCVTGAYGRGLVDVHFQRKEHSCTMSKTSPVKPMSDPEYNKALHFLYDNKVVECFLLLRREGTLGQILLTQVVRYMKDNQKEFQVQISRKLENEQGKHGVDEYGHARLLHVYED